MNCFGLYISSGMMQISQARLLCAEKCTTNDLRGSYKVLNMIKLTLHGAHAVFGSVFKCILLCLKCFKTFPEVLLYFLHTVPHAI